MNPDAIIQSGLARLHGLNETATVELLITGMRPYIISLTLLGAFLEEEPLTEPTLSITIGADNLQRIADGAYSPAQAYLDGELKLKGDLPLAERIAAKLALPLAPAIGLDGPPGQGLQELARILGPATPPESALPVGASQPGAAENPTT